MVLYIARAQLGSTAKENLNKVGFTKRCKHDFVH